MVIYVDGDACPVKQFIIELAAKYRIDVVMVVSICHISRKDPYAKYIIVDNVSQSVDMAIINKVVKNDMAVTDDYGLASILLGKKVRCLSSRGLIYTEENIDHLMYRRHINSKIMKGGGKIKGPLKRSKKDNEKFLESFDQLIQKSLYTPYP